MTDSNSTKKSDLGVRTASAIVMIAVAGGALWAGEWIFSVFIGLIALGLIWEWWGMISKAFSATYSRLIATMAGLLYFFIAIAALLLWRWQGAEGLTVILVLVAAVIATDTLAYFTGRFFGGPKIAPSISPSKTWSGLFGGMLGATIILFAAAGFWGAGDAEALMLHSLYLGPLLAIVAQAGDFLESYIKRKAQVKDSSGLIPGHGGLLDRLDGMLAVFAIFGSLSFLLITAIAGRGGI